MNDVVQKDSPAKVLAQADTRPWALLKTGPDMDGRRVGDGWVFYRRRIDDDAATLLKVTLAVCRSAFDEASVNVAK